MNRKLCSLRSNNHCNDPSQNRICAHFCRLIGQGSVLVHSAAQNQIARGFGHGNGFARQHRFVDIALPILHDAIDRNFFASANLDHVVASDFRDWNVDIDPVAQNPSCLWCQTHKLFDGFAGLAFGARFKIATNKDQCNDNGGSLKINMTLVIGKKGRCKNDHRRISPRRQRAKRHKRIHFGRTPKQGCQSFFVEFASRPNHDQRNNTELGDPQQFGAHETAQRMVQGGKDMATHFHDKNRQG